MTWTAILLSAAGCYLLKLAGLFVPRRLLEEPSVARISALLPIALLAALAAVQALAVGTDLTPDARLAGVAAGVLALVLRAPFLVVVGVAALTAALVRLLWTRPLARSGRSAAIGCGQNAPLKGGARLTAIEQRG